MKAKQKIIIVSVVILIIFSAVLFASQALAFTQTYKSFLEQAGRQGTYNTTLQGSQGYVDTLLGRIILTVISFTGIIFLILTIYSGFQWLTAGGSEEKVTQAKTRVFNATIGVAIALLAFIATNLLFTYLDKKFLDNQPGGLPAPAGKDMCLDNSDCYNNPLGFQCVILEGIHLCGCGGDDECPDGSTCVNNQCQN